MFNLLISVFVPKLHSLFLSSNMCSRKPNQIQALNISLGAVALHPNRLAPLQARYQSLLHVYSKRTARYSTSFHALRLIITIGSLIVPALLSVQNNSASSQDVYWVVWVLSLLVTMSNGVVTLLKIDKKYYLLNTVYQQLMSEGWQYIHLSGKYSGQKTPGSSPTHENQYPFFTQAIEKIRMRHVEEEYYKVTDVSAQSQGQSQTDPLVPPTPLRNPLLQVNELVGTTIRRQVAPGAGQGQTTNTQAQSQGADPLTRIEEVEEGTT